MLIYFLSVKILLSLSSYYVETTEMSILFTVLLINKLVKDNLQSYPFSLKEFELIGCFQDDVKGKKEKEKNAYDIASGQNSLSIFFQ